MRKIIALFSLLVFVSSIFSCNSAANEPEKSMNLKSMENSRNYLKALLYLLDEVNFEENYSLNLDDEFNFILVPVVGCASCMRRFGELMNHSLITNTFIFTEINLTSDATPIFSVEDNLLMRLNLKTQSGMVWMKYRNEQIEYIEQITAFNIDSVVNELTLGAVLGEKQ
jgi:hypothetical protein